MKQKLFIIIFFLIVFAILFIIGIHKLTNTSGMNYKFSTELSNQEIGKTDSNTIWCGNFQIAWNELTAYIGKKIEFENEESELVESLNNNHFTKEMLSNKDYYVKVKEAPFNIDKLKKEIYNDVRNKFNENRLDLLNQLNFNSNNGIFIYSILRKEFEYIEEFDTFPYMYSENNQFVRCFGINSSDNKAYKNVEVMYYNETQDNYGVKIKTKNGEDVILYKTDTMGNFEEIYNELIEMEKTYEGDKNFNRQDYLTVPFINVNLNINYEELCGKYILGTNGKYISNAIQTIQFSLDNKGGRLSSDAVIKSDVLSSIPISARKFNFCQPDCYLFLKENDKDLPYFAQKINSNFLEIIK